MHDLVMAHQGGWDELAYIIIPVALIVVGVRWAEGRARRRAEKSEDEDAGSEDSGSLD